MTVTTAFEPLHVKPITLTGRWVRLEPLTIDHTASLAAAGTDTAIWQYFTSELTTPERMGDWIATALAQQANGAALPFAIIERATDQAIGSTRYLDIQPQHRGLEIGSTWLTPRVWRTPINTECKFLLLQHAFETLGCVRVQLKTDKRNERSQRAIERIGAALEGVLRQHMIVRGTYVRDSVLYSILDREWPMVKARLLSKLAQA